MDTNLNNYPDKPILLIDDEAQFLLSVNMTLSSSGINNILECQDSRDAMSIIKSRLPSLILLDLTMPFISGDEMLKSISSEFPHIPVIMITAVNNLDTAIECMKNGAFDYLVKPVEKDRLITSVKHGLEITQIREENYHLKQSVLSGKVNNPELFNSIITGNKTMESIFLYIEAISRTSLPVLITGETGVGKELIAKAVHDSSGRSGAFVPINIAGIDKNLLADMLFGHEKGAFTGAEGGRKGLLEQAAGGTLFLDEIGDLDMDSQIKLLRLLQEGSYYPVGADLSKSSTARIIVATHCNLKKMRETGDFRHDLYYRLQAHQIQIPPLRDRLDDLPLLINHFIRQGSRNLNKQLITPPKELNILLSAYSFPGNIRELENMIYNAVSLHKSGILSMSSFKQKISSKITDLTSNTPADSSFGKQTGKIIFPRDLPTLKDLENCLIEETMKRVTDNQTIAAEILGLSRRALNNRLQRLKNKK